MSHFYHLAVLFFLIKWSEIRIFACHSGSEFLKADNFAKGLLLYKKKKFGKNAMSFNELVILFQVDLLRQKFIRKRR